MIARILLSRWRNGVECITETHSTTSAASNTTMAKVVVTRLVPILRAPETINVAKTTSRTNRPSRAPSAKGKIRNVKIVSETVMSVSPTSPDQNSPASNRRRKLLTSLL